MRLTVRVPATSANLGPGFDCFGLALDLCNEVTVDTDAAPGVAWEGEGASELPTDGSDLVSHVMASVAEVTGGTLPPMRLVGLNRIPLERGLGSSSAAAVAGAAIALRILGEAATPDAVFGHAARIEGHPDNAGPAVFGGFTIALPDGTVHRFDPHPDLHPVALVPGDRLPTAEARRALPGGRPARGRGVQRGARGPHRRGADPRPVAPRRGAPGPAPSGRPARARSGGARGLPRRSEGAGVPVCVSGAGPTLLAFPREPLAVPEGWRVIEPGIRSRGFELAEE